MVEISQTTASYTNKDKRKKTSRLPSEMWTSIQILKNKPKPKMLFRQKMYHQLKTIKTNHQFLLLNNTPPTIAEYQKYLGQALKPKLWNIHWMRKFSFEMFDLKNFSLKTAIFFRQFVNGINQTRNFFTKKVLKRCILRTVRFLLNSIFKISNSAHLN